MFYSFTIDTAKELSPEEAALPAEEKQEILEEILFQLELSKYDYLSLLDYDYVAEMPHMRDEDSVEYYLDGLADDVRDAAEWHFVGREGTKWSYELRCG